MSPSIRVIHGDCRSVMAAMPADSVDAVVTDPPYGLSDEPDVAEVLRHWLAGDDYAHRSAGFMGAAWDSLVPGPAVWREALRVLKPGGFCLSFFGGRTYDLGVIAMRLAGFEVKELMAWLHGQGMVKSGYVRDDAGEHIREGWAGQTKPAIEPIVMARKPLSERTLAANVRRWGTGAVNVDGCRVTTPVLDSERRTSSRGASKFFALGAAQDGERHNPLGRWPPNVLHDGSQAVLDLFPQTKTGGGRRNGAKAKGIYGVFTGDEPERVFNGNAGSAARFYPSFPPDNAPARYCPKAAPKARVSRCTSCGHRLMGKAPDACPNCGATGDGSWAAHPTVKPVPLLQWMIRLVTPPGGTVLDPFAGTGTTLAAARAEGFDAIGIEMNAEFVGDIHHRLGMTSPALQAAE